MWLELDKGPALMLHFGMTGSMLPTLVVCALTSPQNTQLNQPAQLCRHVRFGVDSARVCAHP